MIGRLRHSAALPGLCLGAWLGVAGDDALGLDRLVGRDAVRAARSWGYQLDGPKPELIARSGCDLSVIDYSTDGTADGALSADDIERIHAAGPSKRVIAYLSIGEAEDYRFYWDPKWSSWTKRPQWLGEENPEWEGNYQVEYWKPAWQNIIFGSAASYLDMIIATGFDGVFLDRVDAYLFWEKSRPKAQREMANFVEALAAYGRSKKEDFAIIVQNGEDLLDFPDYVAVIDGFAKEDLFYGAEQTGEKNDRDEIDANLDALKAVRDAGLPVFLVEYLDDLTAIEKVKARAKEQGVVVTFAGRDLDQPPHCPGN